MINVTKAFIPNKDKFKGYIDRIFESGQLTNNGPLLRELEARLSDYLGVNNLILVANGSLALQVAYKALNLKGEIITTPFSFAATTSTILWENLTPVFADINSRTFNIDPEQIVDKISKNTSAILPVHVFGNPCEIQEIQEISSKYNLKVIYDASHAFGVDYTLPNEKKTSVLNFGDISTLSLHATKLFHSIEGGAIITNDDDLAKKIRLLINFGISGPEGIDSIGTNAKLNEFEAAMGLCVLDEIEKIKVNRKKIWDFYASELANYVKFQEWNSKSFNNYSYAPILFETENDLLRVKNALERKNIYPRRYFYPSLDNIKITEPFTTHSKSFSIDISKRIICLPIYPDLELEEQIHIVNIIIEALKY